MLLALTPTLSRTRERGPGVPCGSSASFVHSLERCLPSPSPGNQKHRKRALNDFRFAPKPSKAVSSHPKAAEAALRLSLRNG